ncbi:MAG: hypothetical protein JWP97_6483 [Labilithrix sp.]|nr:hypothetical protein [Labilithrix sp.]
MLVMVTLATRASAEPLQLRGDAYVQTPRPVGLLVLSGEDNAKPWLSAEGLAWLGAGQLTSGGDVLTMVVRLHDPSGHGDLRVGRFLETAGAIRPLHLDGATGLARTSWGTSVEGFGGAPVVERFGDRAYDWAVGGRVAQVIAAHATVGFAYVQRRGHGRIADEEAGLDFAALPLSWVDVAARASKDVIAPGITDALASVAARSKDLRLELFGTRRSPSRLLPATSLFSVLGDVPSTRLGASLRWRAAPRLDVLGSGASQSQAGRVGAELMARATLRTDDKGDGSLGLELRRQGTPGASWSGIRGIGVVPLKRGILRASTEIEIAAADAPANRGSVWPWVLVAITWQATRALDLAAAAEAGATSTTSRELNTFVRASYAWGR